MSFALYLIGYVLFVGGVAWGLVAAGVRPLWVAITTLILLGVGMMKAVTHTRRRDPVA